MAYQKQKNRVLDMVVTASPYIVSAVVSYQLAIKMGLIDSPKDKRDAKKFRDNPYITTQYVQDNIPPRGTAKSLPEIAKAIFDNDDMYKFNKANKSLKDLYYAKGYIYDNEDQAVRSIKENVKSLIDLSIYSGLFSNYVQEPFISYLDSFLENKYQAELWRYIKDLPVLTIKEASILEQRTNRKISFSADKKIIYTKKS